MTKRWHHFSTVLWVHRLSSLVPSYIISLFFSVFLAVAESDYEFPLRALNKRKPFGRLNDEIVFAEDN